MSFSSAPEVRDIANRYIEEHHTHLASAHIEYVFDSDQKRKKGREVLGEAKLLSGLNAWMVMKDLEAPPEKFFVIIIYKQAWDLLEGNPRVREAIIDHELSHCWVEEEGELSILPHDVEEFHGVARRHGPWKSDVAALLKALNESKNPMLPFDIVLARQHSIEAAESESQEGDADGEKKPRVVKNRKRKDEGDETAAAAVSG